MALTKPELKYLEACMMVADGDGDHAAEYGLDVGALQVKLQEEIAKADDPSLFAKLEEAGLLDDVLPLPHALKTKAKL